MNTPPTKAHQLEPIRLSKYLSATYGISRSHAEAYIDSGFVKVDQVVIEAPQHRVSGTEFIELDPLASLSASQPKTILWHKPADILSHQPDSLLGGLFKPETRSAKDRTGERLLRKHLRDQVCVTPLETGASGLVVYTQDFSIKRQLIQDQKLVEHEIIVDIQLSPPDKPNPAKHATSNVPSSATGGDTEWQPALERLSRMVGHQTKLALSKQTEVMIGLRFASKAYEAGIIADQCQRVGLWVEAMRRIRIGRIALAGINPGQWRFLAAGERF